MTRIRWRSLLTGFESHGDWMPYDLTTYVGRLNRDWAGMIRHWLERQ